MNENINLDEIITVENEVWKDVKGYEGSYKISNYGRLISFKRKKCKLIQINNYSAYPHVKLWLFDKEKSITIHRLVGLHFIPNPEQKPTINHLDGIKTNNYYKNLEWATMQEQLDHAKKLGLLKNRKISGENHGQVKLTEKQVIEIFYSYKTYKITKSDLSKKFNISIRHVDYIIKGKTWKHLNLINEQP